MKRRTIDAKDMSRLIEADLDEALAGIRKAVAKVIDVVENDSVEKQVYEYDFVSTEAANKIDRIIEEVAFIYDRSVGNTLHNHQKGYKNGLVYKVRKALGYTIP